MQSTSNQVSWSQVIQDVVISWAGYVSSGQKGIFTTKSIWMTHPLCLLSVVLIFHSPFQVCLGQTTQKCIRVSMDFIKLLLNVHFACRWFYHLCVNHSLVPITAVFMGHSWICLNPGNLGLEKRICGLRWSPLAQSTRLTLQCGIKPAMVVHYMTLIPREGRQVRSHS